VKAVVAATTETRQALAAIEGMGNVAGASRPGTWRARRRLMMNPDVEFDSSPVTGSIERNDDDHEGGVATTAGLEVTGGCRNGGDGGGGHGGRRRTARQKTQRRLRQAPARCRSRAPRRAP